MKTIKSIQLILLSFLFLLFSSISFGQSVYGISPKNLECDTHTISDWIFCIDTTVNSIEFLILDSLDSPMEGVKVLIENYKFIISEEEIIPEPDDITVVSDSNGICEINHFSGFPPINIKVYKMKALIYQFEFTEGLNGYSYRVCIKLCEN